VKTYLPPKFLVERDSERCIQCKVCVNQCTFDVHYYDDEVRSREENCVGCHRCVVFYPTHALTIRENPLDYRESYNWRGG
jgi:ferredoxin